MYHSFKERLGIVKRSFSSDIGFMIFVRKIKRLSVGLNISVDGLD